MILMNCEEPRNLTFTQFKIEYPALYDLAYTGVEIDETTKENLDNWFGLRELCTDTPARFTQFFRRELLKRQWQYNQLLRLESTEWDPMVSDYMERQIQRAAEGTVKRDTSNTTSNNTTTNETGLDLSIGSDSSTTTGTENTEEAKTSKNTITEDKTETGSTSNTTEGSSTTDTTNGGKDSVTGSDTSNTTNGGKDSVTGSDTSNTTNGGKDSVTGTNSSTGKTTTSANGNTTGLTGTTPDSATYGVTYPDNFNWAYTSGQSEAKTSQNSTVDNTDSGTSTSETTYGSTQNVEGTTSGKETGTSTNDIVGTTTEDGKVTGFNNITKDIKTQDSTQSELKTKKDGTVTEAGQTDIKDNVTSTNDDETRERYSGRHEAPHDLMKRAREYIMVSNAFEWLTDKLDKCFMAIY